MSRTDTRIVYGLCTWWGSIYDVSRGDQIPTCPFCGSPLFESEDEHNFLGKLKSYPDETSEFTGAFVDWCRHPTPCSRTRTEALERFKREKVLG